jgi:hypothetical protein
MAIAVPKERKRVIPDPDRTEKTNQELIMDSLPALVARETVLLNRVKLGE